MLQGAHQVDVLGLLMLGQFGIKARPICFWCLGTQICQPSLQKCVMNTLCLTGDSSIPLRPQWEARNGSHSSLSWLPLQCTTARICINRKTIEMATVMNASEPCLCWDARRV